jgi:amidase
VKPTWGLISRYGIFDLAATFDHLGPMARSAADAAAMLQTLAGWDAKDTTTLTGPIPNYLDELDGVYGARGVKIGLDWDYVATDADPVTIGFIKDAVAVLEEIGAVTRPVKFPSIETLLKYTMTATMAETAAHHDATYPSRSDKYGPNLASMIDMGRGATPVEIGKGIIERQKFRGAVLSMFQNIEVFIMPVFRDGTPTWSEVRAAVEKDFNIIGKFTSPFNATGTPTVTLPCGYSADGRPIGFQLAGAPGSESLLLKVAHAYQQATDWHTRRPPGF